MTTHAMPSPCAVCGAAGATPSYTGPIRRGVFGQFLDGTIFRCAQCGLEWLTADETLALDQYRTGEYRDRVGEQADAGHFFALHDREQFEKVFRVRDVLTRGSVVADVGCAAGAFLDFIKGVAGRTIAIEPAVAYHGSLKGRGHDVCSTAEELAGPNVDLVTSFSVIEHVEAPMPFLRSMRALLKPGAWAVLSTPNRRDVLIEHGPAAYKSFFYRQVHLYYFDAASLREAMERAGFVDIRIEHMHRFGFGNFAGWLRDARPPGRQPSPVAEPFDTVWRTTLESQGCSDYLYVIARNPEAAA